MTTAADIIAALLLGKPAPTLERQTRMPYGWGLWLRGLREKDGVITHAREQAVAAAAMRPPVPRPREPELGLLAAFRSLFYQAWDPPSRDERGLRWFGRIASLLLHVGFAIALLWLSWIHIPPNATSEEAEVRTRLEYIGAGTPEESGGVQAEPSAAQTAQSQGAKADGVPAPQKPRPPQQAEAAQPSQATPVVQAPPAEAESPQRPITVQVPDLPVQSAPTPRLRDPVPVVREHEVVMVETPALQQVQPREVDVRVNPSVNVQVREREVLLPVPVQELRSVTTPTTISPRIREAKAPTIREREVAMPTTRPQRTPAAATPTPTQAATAPAPASTATATSATSSTPSADPRRAAASPSSAATNSAPQPAAAAPGPRPGATPSPRRADEWGDAARNQAGTPSVSQGSGLFDADGKPKLPDGLVGQSTTQPGVPGSRQAAARDAAAANAFLKRVPYAYEPTMFDKDWVPRENLLQEWVRKNIREVEVSIPGTSKKVRCVVSILQLGGGCSLGDGNLHDQPAVARPPPEIPIKRNPIKTDS